MNQRSREAVTVLLSFKVTISFPLAAKGEAVEFRIMFALFSFLDIIIVVIDDLFDSKEKKDQD